MEVEAFDSKNDSCQQTNVGSVALERNHVIDSMSEYHNVGFQAYVEPSFGVEPVVDSVVSEMPKDNVNWVQAEPGFYDITERVSSGGDMENVAYSAVSKSPIVSEDWVQAEPGFYDVNDDSSKGRNGAVEAPQLGSSLSPEQLAYFETLDDDQFEIEVHEAVVASGVPNYLSCRIPLRTKLNIPFWRKELADYHDTTLVDLLEFGFPLEIHKELPKRAPCKNHVGANLHPESIDRYVEKELQEGATMGPFDKCPFTSTPMFAPLNTAPKKDSSEPRIIQDESYPRGSSLNDMLSSDRYLGELIRLRYPGVDDLVDLIRDAIRRGEPHPAMFKEDLSRAFRQLPVDPGCWHVLGWTWRGKLYFDKVLVMGLKVSPFLCQRVTNAIKFMCEKRQVPLVNYLDDMASAQVWHDAFSSHSQLTDVVDESGLVRKDSKRVLPTHTMVFLGVLCDTETLTLLVTEERLLETLELLESWLRRDEASKRDFQVLLGKLHFISTCVRQGRIFVSRLISFMKKLPKEDEHKIPGEVRKDLFWWYRFLPDYNGVSMMSLQEWSQPDEVFCTDACLTGCGGWSQDREFFHAEFPKFLLDNRECSINALELLTIVVACKLWGRKWKGKRILVQCDNEASVVVTNTGRARDDFLQACLRELAFVTAKFEFEVRAVHIRGVDNRIPDALSRWELGDEFKAEFFRLVGPVPLCEKYVSPGLFKFAHDW